jgi:hypothetical protein
MPIVDEWKESRFIYHIESDDDDYQGEKATRYVVNRGLNEMLWKQNGELKWDYYSAEIPVGVYLGEDLAIAIAKAMTEENTKYSTKKNVYTGTFEPLIHKHSGVIVISAEARDMPSISPYGFKIKTALLNWDKHKFEGKYPDEVLIFRRGRCLSYISVPY